jgi:UDP-GlcNAc:undecaprenyl-phosphate GlcNAc-1-phosphate transferase
MPLRVLPAFLTALTVTVVVLPRLAHLAQNIGLLDMPDERKVHNRPKPLVGGLGIALGLLFSSLLFIPLSNLRGLYAGIVLLVVVGFFDDFRELNHRWKFVAQFFAVVMMIYFSRTSLRSFGDLLTVGPLHLGIAGLPLTVFCAVGVVNAVNMIDGLDGLCGGVSLIASCSFAILAYINSQPELVLLSLALAGAVTGFLRYNWYPSKLFLGDGGSLLLGFALVFLSIAITQKQGSIVPPVAALLVLSFPVADAVTVMIKRAVKGRSPFYADNTHFHHILLLLGYCKKSADTNIFAVCGLLSVTAILGTIFAVPEAYLFLVFCIFAALHFAFSFNIRKILGYRAGIIKGKMPPAIRLVEKIGYLANIDEITGLLNRAALIDNLACEFTVFRKQDADLSIVLLDIDHFKRINVFHGREAGDRVLNHVSEVIRGMIRKTDIAGRYESDKFLLILPETAAAGAARLAEKIASTVSTMKIKIDGEKSVALSVSYGVGVADALTESAEKLISTADESLGGRSPADIGRGRDAGEDLSYTGLLQSAIRKTAAK